MEKVSEFLYQFFTSNKMFKAEMKDKIYPLFVSAQKEFPFAVYNIGEVPYATSDARAFPITLSLCYEPESYLEAISFADKMKDAIEEIENGEFVSTKTAFDDTNQFIYVNINFNIIM